jgi:hypothetical protein
MDPETSLKTSSKGLDRYIWITGHMSTSLKKDSHRSSRRIEMKETGKRKDQAERSEERAPFSKTPSLRMPNARAHCAYVTTLNMCGKVTRIDGGVV